ncbi:MAG: gamma-glutamyl-gamma-aminobutyrate hydrolase family protein [Geminicoccaceae bacterium]|nr:MAG: gamma-glutamyl-gamma-aminobutyrate hydrolase family protein [Geminicoccaceae bacterium]
MPRVRTDQRPRIGLTLDWEAGGGFSQLPWYACRQNYVDAISAAGGVPCPLPHEVALVEAYLDDLDGVVVTGGAFDIDPGYYDGGAKHALTTTKDRRTAFEFGLTRGALDRDLPVLGICGGQQLLHVVLGGTLLQHIPDAVPNALAHEQPNPRTEPGHSVTVVEGTLLHRIAGVGELWVNSAHHQAADRVPAGLVVSGRAPDGVIEAIEAPGHRFAVGVQWHPEYGVSAADRPLFEAFVEASRDRT